MTKEIKKHNEKINPSESISRLLVKQRMKESKVVVDREKYKEALDNVEELFSIMHSIYGNLWALNYENNHARDVWTAGLLDLTKNDIVNGINYCINNKNKIPTLTEFRKFCFYKEDSNNLPYFN